MKSDNSAIEQPSCDQSMSRKEFLQEVMKRALAVGALASLPVVADKILVPPAQAAGTGKGTTVGGGESTFRFGG